MTAPHDGEPDHPTFGNRLNANPAIIPQDAKTPGHAGELPSQKGLKTASLGDCPHRVENDDPVP